MQQRWLNYVGLTFVALASAVALNVVHCGARVFKIFDDMKVNLPWPTWLAMHGRVGLMCFVVLVAVAGVAVHRHVRAPLVLGVLGALQLVIAVGYGAALWLVLRTIQGFIS